MSLSDDENLFDDIYGEDEVKEQPKEEKKEEVKEEEKEENEEKQKSTVENSKEEEGDKNVKEQQEESNTSNEANKVAPEETTIEQSVQVTTVSTSTPTTSESQQEIRKADLSRDAGKMFIGGLDWDTTEDRLKEYFSQYGEVIDHTIMRESNGRSRGFGFLTFAEKSSVDAVVRTQHVLDGKVIDPKRAIPREEQDKTGKIFVGGLPPEVRPHEFEDFFSKYGTIIDAQLMLDKDTGRSRGFGFVTFDSPEAVEKVCQGKYIQFGNRQIEVKRAEPRGPQQQQNHIASQQQRFLNQQGYNPAVGQGSPVATGGLPPAYGGVPGVTPEQLSEYYQQVTQYWAQLQQQGGPLAQMAQYAQQTQQQGGQVPSIPGVPALGDPSQNAGGYQQRDNNLPRGPRGGYRGGRGRGRGGYNRRDYHPYSRS